MAKESIELALTVLKAEKANLTPDHLRQLAELTETGEGVRESVTDTLETSENRELTAEQQTELLAVLEARFSSKPEHYKQVEGVNFAEVKKALEAKPEAMYSLAQMDNTGGLPDIIAVEDNAFVFGDCSAASPDRRDLTYDQAAKMAEEFGVDMMSEEVFGKMQKTGKFDLETWSWLATPTYIRESGRALFGRRDGVKVLVSRRNALVHRDYGGWRGVLRVPKA
jgi:hypothetical protein